MAGFRFRKVDEKIARPADIWPGVACYRLMVMMLRFVHLMMD